MEKKISIKNYKLRERSVAKDVISQQKTHTLLLLNLGLQTVKPDLLDDYERTEFRCPLLCSPQ